MDRPEPGHDQHQAETTGGAEQQARGERAHDRIRRSVGRRPMRIINR